MTEKQETTKISRFPLIVAGVIFAVASLIFIAEFIALSGADGGLDEDEITADAYMDIVAPLLVNASAARGQELMRTYGCTACHGNQNLGPDFPVMIENAALRRPPMTAEAYIYESIIHPGAYVVSGYSNTMPRTYGSIPDDDLGDMIAYLSGHEIEPATAETDDAEIVSDETETIVADTTPDDTEDESIEDDIIIEAMPEGGLPLTEDLIREYEINAEFLITGANARRGEQLVEQYGCNVCHAGFAAGIVAPGYLETAQLAAERRPPLSAEAYIYEAIIYPSRYVVEGWPDAMPGDYDEQIPSGDLGDIIAFILNYEEIAGE